MKLLPIIGAIIFAAVLSWMLVYNPVSVAPAPTPIPAPTPTATAIPYSPLDDFTWDGFWSTDVGTHVDSGTGDIDTWTSREGGETWGNNTNNVTWPSPIATKFGARTGLQFDGNDRLCSATAYLTGTSGYVIAYVIIGTTTPNAAQAVWSEGDTSGGSNRYVAGLPVTSTAHKTYGVTQRNADTAEVVYSTTTVTATTGTAIIIEWISTGTAYEIYVNGTSQTLAAEAGANNGDWWGDSTGLDQVSLGNRLDGANCTGTTPLQSPFYVGIIGFVDGSVPNSTVRGTLRTWITDIWGGV